MGRMNPYPIAMEFVVVMGTATADKFTSDGDYARLVGEVNEDTAIVAVSFSNWPWFLTRCQELTGGQPRERQDRLRGNIRQFEIYDWKES